MTKASLRVAVVGATGYVGAELLRILVGHPKVALTFVGGHGKAGLPIAHALPAFRGVLEGNVEPFSADIVRERADVVFCALPHGASAPAVRELRTRGLTTLDLSADFRLADIDLAREWYGEPAAPELLTEAVYGLVELHRESLRKADLIAVPGCYPTASILALAPLVARGLVDVKTIVIDAKSGVTGAGKSPTPSTHYPEMAEGIRAYKVAGRHRHTPEIEQALSHLAGMEVRVTFTPHLTPISRGILATCYATATKPVTSATLREAALELYRESPFIGVLDPGENPDTLWVRGTNRSFVAYDVDERTGRVVAQAVIDNLVKGAAGQAVQCMNVRFDFDELTGLGATALFP